MIGSVRCGGVRAACGGALSVACALELPIGAGRETGHPAKGGGEACRAGKAQLPGDFRDRQPVIMQQCPGMIGADRSDVVRQ